MQSQQLNGFIAQKAERPAVNRKVAGSIPAVPAFISFSMELRLMVRQLSDAQPMYNPKDCFRSPSAPIMLLWRNGSAAVS